MAEGAGVFDDLNIEDFDVNNLENYNDDQLNDYYDKFTAEKGSFDEKYGDSKDIPEYIKLYREKNNIGINLVREERNKRLKTLKKTAWIDEFRNYKKTDLSVLKTYGATEKLNAFINNFIMKTGKVNKKVKGDNRDVAVMFIRSFLSVSDGNGVRPLLNNRESFELLKDTTFSREGSIGKGGILSILKYKGVDVREINVNRKDTMRRLHEDTKEEKEFTKLVNRIFSLNTDTVKKISKELEVPENVVQKTISDDNSSGEQIPPILVKEIKEKHMNGDSVEKISEETKVSSFKVEEIVEEVTRDETKEYYNNKKIYYNQPAYEKLKEMVVEKMKWKNKSKPTKRVSSLDVLKEKFEDLELFDAELTGDDESTSLLLPEAVTEEIIDNSLSDIHSFLHSHAREIESLVLTEQELREFAGILNPKGDADTKIEALEAIANEYRLKALNEPEPKKEQLYNSIRGTAELKADFIRVYEKGEPPKNSEAISILEEQINSNESANDISRFKRFKKWIKDNWLGASALIITIASLLTTVIISARNIIKSGAKAVKSFGQSLYKTFKNIAKTLGPIFGPVISAIGGLLSILLKYAAEGIAWLAKNLWALVIAIAYLIYSRYQRK